MRINEANKGVSMVTKKLVSSLALVLVALAVTALVASRADAQGGPYQYFAVSPCRAYDTRSAGSPPNGGGVINSATIRTFTIKGSCGVPADAVAVSLNLTVTQPTAPAGDLRIAPYPGAFPNVSTLNYLQNDTLANGAIVPLGASPGADFQVLGAGCAGASCTNTYTYHLIIDVTGYFHP
jgi:hypothetical protein